jgi:hypothetical protein
MLVVLQQFEQRCKLMHTQCPLPANDLAQLVIKTSALRAADVRPWHVGTVREVLSPVSARLNAMASTSAPVLAQVGHSLG